MNDGISMNLLFRVQTLCSDEPKCDWISLLQILLLIKNTRLLTRGTLLMFCAIAEPLPSNFEMEMFRSISNRFKLFHSCNRVQFFEYILFFFFFFQSNSNK